MILDPTSTLRLLGHDERAKLLIIHADDAGMCHSANVATAKALKRGIVTSASVMAPCPWFTHFAKWAKANPEADIGIHLTLTSEWEHYRWRPISPVDRVPSLVDPDGFMWRTTKDIFDHAHLSEMEIEARAQIELALRSGIKPTHIDVHMGVFSVEGGREVFLRLAEEYNIMPRLYLSAQEASSQPSTDRPAPSQPGESQDRRGIPAAVSLRLSSKGATLEEMKAALQERIRALTPGIWQITLHLNGDDDEIRAVTPDWENRFRELTLYTDDETEALFKQEGVTLVGYRVLNELWRREGSHNG